MNNPKDLQSHWNTAYNKEDQKLGWFEENPAQTMQLIESCKLETDAKILNVGVGTTTLIEALLDKGYTNLIANDLSAVALNKLKNRVLKSHQYNLKTVVDDLTKPSELSHFTDINLWIDRAVLHFFLKPEEQIAYFKLIKSIVAENGYVLIAVFSLNGAEKCCGLDLKRYNVDMLKDSLGDNFKLIDSFNYTFINPFGGERPYIYTFFKRC